MGREWQDAYIAKSLNFSGKSINRELPSVLTIRRDRNVGYV